MCTCGVVSGPLYPGIEELFAAENDATTFDRLLRSDPLLWDMQHPVSGWTPMMLAAQRGYLATVNFLLEQGCDTSQFTCRWGSALSVASHFGHADIITCLIRRGGADIEFSCGIVGPPLLVAAKRGYMACVTTLLDHGVNIDATDIIGRTALSYAASRGFENIVRTLLDRGADVRVRDQGGLTAVGRALQTLNARCADIIAVRD
jgi:ankyrin repeat protein